MGLFERRKQIRVDRRESLNSVPVLHPEVTVATLAAERIVLKVPVARDGSWLDWLRPAGLIKSYELDEFGTFVVRQVDSQRSVLDIVRAFERQFQLSPREAELGVVAFLKLLMKRRVLSVVVAR